jgi:MFS family permease
MPVVTVGSRRRPTRHVGPVRVLSSVAGVVTVGVFPVFLVGGLGVQLQHELHFGAASQGIAAAGFFVVAAVFSRAMGSLTERIGARLGMQAAAAGSSVCLFGLAMVGNQAWMMAVLWLSALPSSLGQPASNLLVAQGVPANRRGLGFGVKQSAIPLATLLAGFAVPSVALTIGWRWVFVIAGLIGVVATVTVPWLPQAERSASALQAERGGVRWGALVLIAAAGGLGSAAANSLGSFVTTTSVAVGFGPGTAGLVLSLGSFAGLTIRLVVGAAADRWKPNLLRLITGMMLVGSVGFGLMAVPSAAPFMVGVAVAFGAGWAWPGLLNFSVAQLAPDRVASATSFTQTGIYLGGSLGPLLFGVLAEHVGLSGAWLSAGASAVCGGVLMLFVRR